MVQATLQQPSLWSSSCAKPTWSCSWLLLLLLRVLLLVVVVVVCVWGHQQQAAGLTWT
jgi:hypothetical protein